LPYQELKEIYLNLLVLLSILSNLELYKLKAGLSIKTPGFSSKVQVNPSFQKPPLFRLPLNQTQHFEVFKIRRNLVI